MSALLTALGLQSPSPNTAPPPSYAATAIIFQFLFAHAAISTRPLKNYYRIDHNVSPRQDLTKYGPAAVAAGKLTQKQLNRLHRIEGAHANSIEHLPFFVGALIWAHVAGLETTEINRSALAYVLVRIAYAVAYVFIEKAEFSLARGVLWWMSNFVCCRLFWLGGNAINGRS